MDNEDDLSGPMDEEDIAAIAALSHSDVAAIDHAILSHLSVHWKKTAFVVAQAMYSYPDKYDEIPDVFYGIRVVALSVEGLLEARGDLQDMRFSEIREITVGDRRHQHELVIYLDDIFHELASSGRNVEVIPE